MKELQKDQYKTQVNIKIIIRVVPKPRPTNFRPQLEHHLKWILIIVRVKYNGS